MVRQGGGGQGGGGLGGGGAASAFNEVYLVTNWFEELRERMGKIRQPFTAIGYSRFKYLPLC